MTLKLSDIPGHEGFAAPVLPDGTLARSSGAFTRAFIGYQGACSCGWSDRRRFPPTPEGAKDAEGRWYEHAKPLLLAAPPNWLVVKSNLLCEQIVNLAGERPLAALTLLAQVESWQRTLLDQAVTSARAAGASWAEVGEAMGVSKQAAHERFRDA
ncbi:hypothetical protein [Nonomuraea typhae]|uniref:Helix-turn-helix domain-containing protein n=1 Tax=Nonomuraea typhae TaxID=2603600 RepID=A0ABW7YVH0_9ACTN